LKGFNDKKILLRISNLGNHRKILNLSAGRDSKKHNKITKIAFKNKLILPKGDNILQNNSGKVIFVLQKKETCIIGNGHVWSGGTP